MGYINGVDLIPASGEYVYDPELYQWITGFVASGQVLVTPPPPAAPYYETIFSPLGYQVYNYFNGGPQSDYSVAMDDLAAQFPGCITVALVVAWFGNSRDITQCEIYPSTVHNGSLFLKPNGGWEFWEVSSIVGSAPIAFDPDAEGPSGWIYYSQNPIPNPPPANMVVPPAPNSQIIPITKPDGIHAAYGGTPSDDCVVRCIRDLKSRGYRVVFYPFILMDILNDYPWRGRIVYNEADISSAATTAVNNFLGSAATSQFTRDTTNLTVYYSGSATDYTYRRFILHYANLCVIAGGVDLFLLGSELVGIEPIRGPNWTQAGTVSGGTTTWDYPFVAGLIQLADDVRSVFDAAGLTKDTTNLHNLITYSADWSIWMGYQHPGENGQWPHLDQFYAHDNIDVVSFDNYLPLTDWTTADGGLDASNWLNPAPSGSWPPSPSAFNGLGLTGQPTIYSMPYLKANIEGGQYFDWFYYDSNNLGPGLDPNGSDLIVSLPQGDRLAQSRNQYYPKQQLLANKQLRWWWNNQHYAIYDTGSGWEPQGSPSAWVPNSKSIIFAEYGAPACDKGTNQPNKFYAPASSESYTPFWSIWDPSQEGSHGYPASGEFWPRRDDYLQLLALQAIYEYWVTDGNNETVGGVPMIETAFLCAWNWDARPFPIFPQFVETWGDTGNWPAGFWIGGKGPFIPIPAPSSPPAPGPYSTFPAIDTLAWSATYTPIFSTKAVMHVSGREARASKYLVPLWSIELNYNLLRLAAPCEEFQELIGFFEQSQGENASFYFEPLALSPVAAQIIGTGDASTTTFSFAVSIGGYMLTPANVGTVSAVYLNGVAQPAGGYAVNATALAPTVTFATAPGAGVAITADFDWYFLCRFDDDSEDAEEFMAQLYALRSLKLKTVRQ